MKGVVDKLDIKKLVNIITGLDNLKTEVEDLGDDKLKTFPVGLEELSDVVSKEVVKNSKFNKLNSKVNKLANNIPDAIILISINQQNTDKQSLEKKVGDVGKNYVILVVYLLLLFLIQKLEKLRIKYQIPVI